MLYKMENLTIEQMQSIVRKVDLESFLDLVTIMSTFPNENKDWHEDFAISDIYHLQNNFVEKPDIINVSISESFAELLIRCYNSARQGNLCLEVDRTDITIEVDNFISNHTINQYNMLDFYEDKCNIVW